MGIVRSVAKQVVRPVRSLANSCGIDVVPFSGERVSSGGYPPDFSDSHKSICERVAPFTMTSPERVHAVIEAVRYLVSNNIAGDFVECGVWKGGSSMAMVLALQEAGCNDRELFLYDTYTGMSAPEAVDVSLRGEAASEAFAKTAAADGSSEWCLSPLDEVKQNLASTNYPPEKMHFVQGKVEDTIPATMPDKIALLRLDTDWYASTKHEMNHLFPLLQPGGVLIIDDYGHWRGSRQAVDEYIAEKQLKIMLGRIDYTGRIAIKN